MSVRELQHFSLEDLLANPRKNRRGQAVRPQPQELRRGDRAQRVAEYREVIETQMCRQSERVPRQRRV